MRAGDEVGGGEETRADVGLLEVAAGVGRVAAVERQIAALRADHDLVALQLAFGDQRRERHPDDALAALRAVVDGGINDVGAEGDRGDERLAVAGVGRVVGLAEICADPD